MGGMDMKELNALVMSFELLEDVEDECTREDFGRDRNDW